MLIGRQESATFHAINYDVTAREFLHKALNPTLDFTFLRLKLPPYET